MKRPQLYSEKAAAQPGTAGGTFSSLSFLRQSQGCVTTETSPSQMSAGRALLTLPACPLPQEVTVVSVMPCFDKKLEASRDDFFNPQVRPTLLLKSTNDVRDRKGQSEEGTGGSAVRSADARRPF
jgi:hypothetical protein